VCYLLCLAAKKAGRGFWLREGDQSGLKAAACAACGERKGLGEWKSTKASFLEPSSFFSCPLGVATLTLSVSLQSAGWHASTTLGSIRFFRSQSPSRVRLSSASSPFLSIADQPVPSRTYLPSHRAFPSAAHLYPLPNILLHPAIASLALYETMIIENSSRLVPLFPDPICMPPSLPARSDIMIC
jgi:hypothetical protein